jgi:hypothetical protein
MKFEISNICTAFDSITIGSKVLNKNKFLQLLEEKLNNYDRSKDRVLGQHFVIMPEAFKYVSAGDGLRSNNPQDYIIKNHREGPKMFLKRRLAGEVHFLATVVYSREAYLTDPDITTEEIIDFPDCDYVIVAVIASSGPEAPVTPFRFVHNLAGGNYEYYKPKDLSKLSEWGDFIVNKAKTIINHWNTYSVVSD